MSPNKPRLLIAEDHEDTRDLLTLVLTRENYEIETSPSVREALQLAKRQRFDVIITDSHLNDGTGVELCRGIREYDNSTPIIFYSGLAYEKDKQDAYEAGALGYLVKPVSTSLLVQTLSKLLVASKRAQTGHTVGTRKDSGDLQPGLAL